MGKIVISVLCLERLSECSDTRVFMDESILVASSEHPLLSKNARTSSNEDIVS